MLIGEIVLSAALMVLIVTLGIRRTVRYIDILKEECDILGCGDLDYQITVKGRNELSMLAAGLDNMRRALKEISEKEEELSLANRRIITEMSHDLRTPLTSLLIYTGILEKMEITDLEQMRKYISKINKKAQQIKCLSDNIFKYALSTEKSGTELEEPATFLEIFYDPLSEAVAYLTEQGYIIKTDLSTDERNIEKMMESMKGTCRVEQVQDMFQLELGFPWKSGADET